MINRVNKFIEDKLNGMFTVAEENIERSYKNAETGETETSADKYAIRNSDGWACGYANSEDELLEKVASLYLGEQLECPFVGNALLDEADIKKTAEIIRNYEG